MFGGLGVRNPASLLDNAPLRELLTQNVRFDGIRRAIEQGHLDAVAVTASAYATARSVTFFQGRPELASWTRVRRIGRATPLTIDHLMASAAVPFVFPPVQIGGEFYGDGSMRHRAPLSPAIHLGADRMLIVGVRDERPDAEPPLGATPEPPTFAHLGGYMLDTLFMDGLYTDLERLSRTNRILEQLGDRKLSGNLAALRPLHSLVIVPQQDLRSLAAEHVRELPRGVRILLRGLGAQQQQRHAARELSAVRVRLHARVDRHGLSRRHGDGRRAARVLVRPADGDVVRAGALEARARPLGSSCGASCAGSTRTPVAKR